jgi:energy-coupling factor transporter ATP-binding protein EcfA2
MQLKLSFSKNTLVLPKRYEILEREASSKGAELTKIVRKIDSANSHIQKLLGRIHVGGIGQFQLFFGESGSGKTTFLRTLPNFFKDIEITSFNITHGYDDILTEIEKQSHIKSKKIFIIDERDNPTIVKEHLRDFFEKLRVLFRKPEGAVLLIWPITDESAAAIIKEIAWSVGKDSISPVEGSIYKFDGLPKSEYFEVADETVRNLNNGESLDSFGVSKELTIKILTDSNTIGDFYARLEGLAFDLNEKTWKILEEKIKPKVWILLAGDSSTELDRTTKSLTQGIESKIDVDRMLAYLDDESNESAYLNDWRKRRAHAGFLFRFLDVRLFTVSPNLALSAIRVYGSDPAKNSINKKSESKAICHDSLRRSSFYLSMTSQSNSSKKSDISTKPDTQHEYLRLQQNSKSQDKGLNKAMAATIENTLVEDGYSDFKILSEKQDLTGTNLKPDIQINLTPKETICLELTWRTTGKEIPGELAAKQNTLSPGHIQKYVLEKTMEYVKELGL